MHGIRIGTLVQAGQALDPIPQLLEHGPAAWELMWAALPLEYLGLEWEPCHPLLGRVEPLRQLRKWARWVFHIHGMDATVAWDVLLESGLHGPQPLAWHRTSGFGDTDWTALISILRQAGYRGNIDIRGWHDLVYQGALEMTGLVYAPRHLKRCRGGAFVSSLTVPNPTSRAVAG